MNEVVVTHIKHTCHAQGCEKVVPEKMFMCSTHWFMVNKGLRDRIWVAYRVGQEVDKKPSAEYLATAKKCIDAVAGIEASRKAARAKIAAKIAAKHAASMVIING